MRAPIPPAIDPKTINFCNAIPPALPVYRVVVLPKYLLIVSTSAISIRKATNARTRTRGGNLGLRIGGGDIAGFCGGAGFGMEGGRTGGKEPMGGAQTLPTLDGKGRISTIWGCWNGRGGRGAPGGNGGNPPPPPPPPFGGGRFCPPPPPPPPPLNCGKGTLIKGGNPDPPPLLPLINGGNANIPPPFPGFAGGLCCPPPPPPPPRGGNGPLIKGGRATPPPPPPPPLFKGGNGTWPICPAPGFGIGNAIGTCCCCCCCGGIGNGGPCIIGALGIRTGTGMFICIGPPIVGIRAILIGSFTPGIWTGAAACPGALANGPGVVAPTGGANRSVISR